VSATELVEVRGPDARSYLQVQLSQDLGGAAPPASLGSLLLDPNGTVVAAGLVHLRSDEDVDLEVPLGVAALALARLQRFALRVRVDFGVAAAPAGTRGWLADELARIDAGIPGVRELAAGLVAHSLPPDVLEATVSFTKGCYPGQELVARMHARGAAAPYTLRRARLEAPVSPGAEAGDPRFKGTVTSVAPDPAGGFHALVVLHRSDAQGATVEVRTPSGVLEAVLR